LVLLLVFKLKPSFNTVFYTQLVLIYYHLR